MGRQGVPPEALDLALEAVRHAYHDPARAEGLVEDARRAGGRDPEVAAVTGRALGMVAAARGDLADSVRLLRLTVRRAEAAGLAARAAQARGSLGYALVLTGRGPAAVAELERAVAVLSAGVDGARLLMQQGLVLTELRRIDPARRTLHRALRTLAAAGGEDLLEGDIRNNLAVVEIHRLDWARAAEQLDRAEALFTGTGMTGRTAMVWHNRAWAAGLRGDVPAALTAFDEAGRRYTAAGMATGLLVVERAEALLTAGLVAEAREAAAEAVAELEEQRNQVDLVHARVLLAEALLLDDDAAAAREVAARAGREAARQGIPGWAALAAFAGLRAREASGVRPAVLADAGHRVAAELADAGWVTQSLDARLLVARTAVRAGRPDEARAALDAVRRAGRRGPAGVRVRAWHAEALHRRAAGDLAGTRSAVTAGLRVLDGFRAGLGATDLRAHAAVLAGRLGDLGVEVALESGRPAAVLAAVESARAASLWLRPARPPDDEALAADLAELRRLAADRRSGSVEPGSGRARQAVLERAVRDRARHAAGAAGQPHGPLDLGALHAALGDRVLVELVTSGGSVSAVVAAGGRLRLVPLAPEAEVAAASDALSAGLRWLVSGGPRSADGAAELVRRSAARLDGLLVGPALRAAAPPGADAADGGPLVIVPGARLGALPWAALPTLARRSFTVAPSAGGWLRAATQVLDPVGGVLLAHGPGLPGAAAEVHALAGGYPGALALTGPAATVTTVLAAMDGADVVHLAAHGHLRLDNPMFSALALADGPLTLHDLERLAAAPRQVVLASCDAGLGAVYPHDEVVGLATALLTLGTVAVVAPVLAVPDDATARLVEVLHDGLRTGAGPAEALAAARRQLLAGGGPADVVAAAGFTPFGAG